VTLVGAGPGDPDLLTVRAARALGSADVVLFDALCDARVLELCPRAKRCYVGKRRGKPSLTQGTISKLLVRFARRGLDVVRLKAGDPFVFGRGGEEVAYVQDAGIDVDVVPGVTSAFAAPLVAGIPVTHREVSRSVVVVSAVPEAPMWSLAEKLVGEPTTWVVLMGMAARARISRTFRSLGHPDSLGVAVVLAASTLRERVYRTTLAGLAELEIEPEDRDLPGVLVMGDVTRLGELRESGALQHPNRADDRDLEQVARTRSGGAA
jgi:uroporphyrin-III C-methyltransferase